MTLASVLLASEGCNALLGVEDAEVTNAEGGQAGAPVEGQGGAAGGVSGTGGRGGAGGQGGGLTPLIATKIAVGDYHACAAVSGGEVRCWGNNEQGQLGDGSTTSHPQPQPVLREDRTPLTGVQAIALNYGSCALVDNGGKNEVYCWGDNERGQLGDGTTADRPFAGPVLLDQTGTRLTGVTALALGNRYACALTGMGNDAQIYCWGGNDSGQLGDGTTTDSPLPKLVLSDASGTTQKNVQAMAVGDIHSCLLTYNDEVLCWGGNTAGMLGDGTTKNSPFPTPVLLNGASFAGAKAISLGNNHSCALFEGKAMCWGDNAYGQLGDGTKSERLSPTLVVLDESAMPLIGVDKIESSFLHTCAIMSNTNLRCWGSNGAGQLGDGTAADRLFPRAVLSDQLGAELTTVEAVAGGDLSTCAIIKGGEVRCWGADLPLPPDSTMISKALYPTTVMQ